MLSLQQWNKHFEDNWNKELEKNYIKKSTCVIILDEEVMKKNEVVIKERERSGETSLGSGGDNREGSWMSWENRVEREMSQLTELQETRDCLANTTKAEWLEESWGGREW